MSKGDARIIKVRVIFLTPATINVVQKKFTKNKALFARLCCGSFTAALTPNRLSGFKNRSFQSKIVHRTTLSMTKYNNSL